MHRENVYGQTVYFLFKGFFKVFCVLLLAFTFFSKTEKLKDVRKFHKGFVLEIDPVTPAYSVLEDEYLNFDLVDQKPWIPEGISAVNLAVESNVGVRLLSFVDQITKPSVEEIQSMRARVMASLKPQENSKISELLPPSNIRPPIIVRETFEKNVRALNKVARVSPKFKAKGPKEQAPKYRKVVLKPAKMNLATMLAKEGLAYNLEIKGKRLQAAEIKRAKPVIKAPTIASSARRAPPRDLSQSSRPLRGVAALAKTYGESGVSRQATEEQPELARVSSSFDGTRQAATRIDRKNKIAGVDEAGQTRWVVHRTNPQKKMPEKQKPKITARNSQAPSSTNPGRETSTERSAQIDPSDLSSFATKDTQNDVKSISLKGRINLTGGLAFTGDGDHLVVYRKRLEEVYEYGRVYIDQGEFEIYVEENIGKLVAEMRSSGGEVLGRGKVAINSVFSQKNQVEVEGYEITLQPIARGFSGKVIVAGSSYLENFSAVEDATVSIDGFDYYFKSVQDGSFLDQNVFDGSNALLKVQAKDFWSTIKYSSTSKSNEVELYSDKLMESLKGLIYSDRESLTEFDQNGIIWGVVRKDGTSISGARVSLGEESDSRPLYFNEQMLPDPSLQSTSSNGLYVFVNVEPGIAGLEVNDNNQVSDLKIIPVEEKTVSRVDFNIGQQIRVPVEVFDADNSDQPVSTSYRLLGSRENFESFDSGEGGLEFNLGHDPLFIEVDGDEEYSALTVTHQRSEKIVEIPMVKTEWIKEAYQTASVNKDVLRGEIVGFVKSDTSFNVVIDHYSAQDAKIIYIDAEGEFFMKPYERKAIGYIVLNAPQGIRSIVVQPSEKGVDGYSVNVGYVEPETISVLTHEL